MRIFLATIAFVLFSAAPSAAQETFAPPGNAGVDEYLETVPEAGGVRPRDRKVKVPPTLSDEVRGQLESAGPDGAAAAKLAEYQAPLPAKAAGGTSGGGGATDGAAESFSQPKPGNPRPIPAVVGQALTGSEEGAELWFPAIIVATALGALALALRRRRSEPVA